MFDIGSSELLLIIVVAVVVIGPKDLPHALYKFGQIVGKAKGMARHFRTGLDAMVREAELEELQKKWAAENARIMAEHPPSEAQAEAVAVSESAAATEANPPAPPSGSANPLPEPAATPFAPTSLAQAQADLPLPEPDSAAKRAAP